MPGDKTAAREIDARNHTAFRDGNRVIEGQTVGVFKAREAGRLEKAEMRFLTFRRRRLKA